LFGLVNIQISTRLQAVDYQQQPKFKVIKGAGHEVGDFFFVPQKN